MTTQSTGGARRSAPSGPASQPARRRAERPLRDPRRSQAGGRRDGAFTPSQDRQWATVAHFGGFVGFIPSLAIFLLFRDRGPFTAQEAKEALNFTLPLSVVMLVAFLLAQIPIVGGVFGIIGLLVWVYLAASGLIAGINVNKGRPYRYPFNLRLIS